MKVFYLLVIVSCLWCGPVESQFFYSTFTPTAHFPSIYNPQPQHFAPIQQQQYPGAAITYNLPPIQSQSVEFRGFGYRTDHKDGARSTVYYVSGPEASILSNLPNSLPNVNIKTKQSNVDTARSLASNSIDSNAFPNIAEHIRGILQPLEFQRLFDTANTGVFNFYTYPAGTAPLIQSLDDNNETTTSTANETTESSTIEDGGEAEAVDSVLDSRFLPVEEESSKNELASNQTASSTTILPFTSSEVSSEPTSTTTTSTTTTDEDESGTTTDATTTSTETTTTV